MHTLHHASARSQIKSLKPGSRYYQLALDLIDARRDAERAVAASADGGTCNADAVALSLPRWAEKQVMQAAEAAGVGCFVWRLYDGSKRFVFPHRCGGVADARTDGAEAMRDALSRMGYNAVVYSAID